MRLLFGYPLTGGGHGIKDQPVSPHHPIHILGALHPPLDLHRTHPGPAQGGQQGQGLQVVHRKEVTGVVGPAIEPAAGLNTAPPQSALTAEIAAEKTEPRVTETHGPVDKNLQLRPGFAGDGGNLRQRELAGQHHPGETHGGKLLHRQAVVGTKQGTGVETQLGEKTATEGIKSQILNNQSIDLEPGQKLDGGGGRPQLLLLDQAVHRRVNLDLTAMGILNHGGELGRSEVPGQGSGIGPRRPDIDRIGPGGNRRLEGLQTTGRSQQFHLQFSSPERGRMK